MFFTALYDKETITSYENFASILNIDKKVVYSVIRESDILIFKNSNVEIHISTDKLQKYLASGSTHYISSDCRDISDFPSYRPFCPQDLIKNVNDITYGALHCMDNYKYYLIDRWMVSNNSTYNTLTIGTLDKSNTNIAIYRFMNDEISSDELDRLLISYSLRQFYLNLKV